MKTETPYTSATTHKGDMRCHTVYTNLKGSCTTDVPEALGGLGEFPSPGQMLAACAASCMLSKIAYTGKNKGFGTEGICIHAAAHETSRSVNAIKFHIDVPIDTTPEVKKILRTAVTSCPVVNSLTEKIAKEISWQWKDGEEETGK